MAGISARFSVLAAISLAAVAVVASARAEQPLAAYAYSRETISGVPTAENDAAPFPESFYLYVEVGPGAQVSPLWASVRGRFYDCALVKVAAPVVVESDPAVPTQKKETLVPQTANDVYRVDLGQERQSPVGTDDKERTTGNEAAIALLIDNSSAYAVVKTIKALRPSAAP
jgi:hypothetical protein